MEPPSKKNGSNNQLAGSVYLADILSKHRMWLESGGQKGKRACLVDQDLTNADLSGSDLSEADMSGAVLSFANLQNACLRRAKLVDSTFEHACLHNADFHVADLKCADLEKTSGLLGGKLAGADLTDAKLPESFILLETLDIVKEASLNARKIFFAMLLTCAYALLTLATTEDIKLLTNSVSSTLPIIGTQIRIVNFYRIMPLLLLCIYFYFHLYLQRLWEAQASLPAIFPDGRKLNEKVYPWIMNGLVFKYFERLRNDQPYLIWLQFLLSIVLAWCFVPFTLAALWLRYLRRHDLMTSSFHIFFLVIGVAGGILFYRIAASTLRGDTKKPLIKPPFVDHTKHSKSDSRLNVRLPKLANTGILKFGDQSMIVILCCLLMFFTISVTYCKPLWVLHLFEKAGCSPVMDLTESFISTPPSNWTGESEAEFAFVKGANLKGVNLRMANLQRAFLVRADLRGADLSGANLQEAILLEAKLQGTILRGADLRKSKLVIQNESVKKYSRAAILQNALLDEADLRDSDLPIDLQRLKMRRSILKGVRLEKADLRRADLSEANLKGANLSRADLSDANLMKAKLSGADLSSASLYQANLFQVDLSNANLNNTDLSGTDLRQAEGLTREQIRGSSKKRYAEGARNWILGHYDSKTLAKLGLPDDFDKRQQTNNFSNLDLQLSVFYDADLQEANFKNANLRKCDFSNAKLQGADLRNADLGDIRLQTTNFARADLRGARFGRNGLNGLAVVLNLANLHGVEGLSSENIQSYLNKGAVSISSDKEWEIHKQAADMQQDARPD